MSLEITVATAVAILQRAVAKVVFEGEI